MNISPKENHSYIDRINRTVEATRSVEELIIEKDASYRFELIGKIIEDGINRSFKREEIIQLITTGIIKL